MADITKQTVLLTGLNPTFSSAGGGGSGAGTDDIVDNDGKTLVYVKNENAGSIQVTITSQTTALNIAGYGSASFSDVVSTLLTGEERVFGPFPKSRFDDVDENIVISYDEISSVSIAALKITV